MGLETLPLFADFFATDATATAVTDAAATAATADVASAGAPAILTAGSAPGAAIAATNGMGAGAVTGLGAGAAGGGLLGNLGASTAQGAGMAVASSLLRPQMPAPTVPPVIGMPDPLAQEQAKKQSMIEQMARRGRASTILTDSAGGSGKLGA